MAHDFDAGFCAEPFRTLCADYPDETVYPAIDFRVEWGPIFHRGRLDGSGRILVLGQDPAAHETYVRRILVGAAGQRLQGFLFRLGIERSYVMVNTFLYSVFGQHGGEQHQHDAKIAAYRSRWLDALLVGTKVEAVVALGHLADAAWTDYQKTPSFKKLKVVYAHILHPTYPDSSAKTPKAYAKAVQQLFKDWNKGLTALSAGVKHPDVTRALALYDETATTFPPGDLAAIPELDFPAGLPAWMRGAEAWANRGAPKTAPDKERLLSIVVPASVPLPR